MFEEYITKLRKEEQDFYNLVEKMKEKDVIEELWHIGDFYSDIYVWYRALKEISKEALEEDFADSTLRYILSYLFGYPEDKKEEYFEYVCDFISNFTESFWRKKENQKIKITIEVEDEK